MSSTAGSAIRPYELLHACAQKMGRPFIAVVAEYAIVLRPEPTDVEGKIRYFETAARLMGDLATSYEGPPVFESKGNQRKLLTLRYFSKKSSATTLDLSSDLNMSLTNASQRLKRYYEQGLLTRTTLRKGKPGRPTKIYRLTETGLKRLAFLEKNVKFKRIETEASKRFRLYQRIVELAVRRLRAQGIPR